MRVFVSSTVFDLVDVRAEVAELLRELGIAPVMSDDKLTDFAVVQDVNSIETCLVNVESSEEVVVKLDQRYGPRLGASGFENISATHLEYKRAVQAKRPIHVFVRDRLDADYSIWKRNKRSPDVVLSWVQHEKDHGLLELLDEHTNLVSTSPVTNWYSRFTSSVDLKAALRRYLESRILPDRLVEAIHRNEFPMFDIRVETELGELNAIPCLNFSVIITNVGGAPAFNFRAYYQENKHDNDSKETAIVAPGSSTKLSFVYGLDHTGVCPNQRMIAEYDSPIGVSVTDVFNIHGRIVGPFNQSLISGGRLIDRNFKRSNGISLKIDD